MASFPSSIVSYTNPSGTSPVTSPDHAAMHTSENNEIIQIEQKLGIGVGTPTAGKILTSTGNGTSVWSQEWDSGTLGTATIFASSIGTPTITGGTVKNSLLGTNTIQGGTANGITLGTPSIGTISGIGTTTALSFGQGIAPNSGSLTDSAGGTFQVNAATAQIYYSVMGTAAGNRTITTPLNPTAWQYLEYYFKASGSANGTLVWGTAFQISQDSGTPTLGTGTSWNKFPWRYNPVSTKWDFCGQITNLI